VEIKGAIPYSDWMCAFAFGERYIVESNPTNGGSMFREMKAAHFPTGVLLVLIAIIVCAARPAHAVDFHVNKNDDHLDYFCEPNPDASRTVCADSGPQRRATRQQSDACLPSPTHRIFMPWQRRSQCITFSGAATFHLKTHH